MAHPDTSALAMLANTALAELGAQEQDAAMQNTSNPSSSTPGEDALADQLRKAKLKSSEKKAIKSGSGFATLNKDPDGESCWSKTARKNRDKGVKTWKTFSIIDLRQVASARVHKPEPSRPPVKKPKKKQERLAKEWMKGYDEAEDKFGYINRLPKEVEVGVQMLGLNMQQSMGMKGQVEKAGEMDGLGEFGEEAWEEWSWNCDDQDPFLNK